MGIDDFRQKNILTKLVKDLNKRMADFENSVEELKLLKMDILEMHDEINKTKAANEQVIEQLEQELKDNKVSVLKLAAQQVGKVLISRDELSELETQVSHLKQKQKNVKDDLSAQVEARVEELLKHRVELQEIKHKAETSVLQSNIENYKIEIENLHRSIKRMTEELESQKQLTTNLAMANRPIVGAKE
jgi:chromosome segregation ATPase